MEVSFDHPVATTRAGSVLPATNGLDIILPCCNPSPGWASELVRNYTSVKQLLPEVPLQLILVNDGSVRNFCITDVQYLRESIPEIFIVSYPINKGKGHAIREGLKYAAYEWQVCTDLDFPFGIEPLKDILTELENGADIAAGERGQSYLKLLPLKRKVVTLISRAINRHFLRMSVYDAQAGIKGFNSQGRTILQNTTIDGFLYDSEFIFKAGRKQLNIRSIPVHCRPGIYFSSFKFKLLWKELRNYLKFFTT